MSESNAPLGVEMDETPQIDKLAAALAKAQAAMTHADPSRTAAVTKDGTKKRKYATLADVMDAARPHLSANGLCVVQHPTTGNGSIILTTWLIHESGQWMRSRMEFPRPDSQQMSLIQALGTALTYARRYAYAAIVGVAVEDDDGEGAERPGEGRHDSGPVLTFPFGKNKDQPIQGAAVKDLEWWAKTTRENIADPAKASYRASNEALLKAVETELERQTRKPDVLPSGAQLLGDKPPPADAYEEACRLLRTAPSMERVSQVMRRAHDSGKMTPDQLKGLDVVADKRLAELKSPPPGDEDAPF